MTLEERVTALEKKYKALARSVKQMQDNQTPITSKTDNNAMQVKNIAEEFAESVYPAWDSKGYSYFAGERVSYEDKYYRCIQDHKSQVDWTPDTAVSLWVSISDPSEEYPEWVQPTGAHDAYNKGDKVSHNEKHWVSDVDSNVWEPSVYGWSEV